jgi:hypothetical protein
MVVLAPHFHSKDRSAFEHLIPVDRLPVGCSGTAECR